MSSGVVAALVVGGAVVVALLLVGLPILLVDRIRLRRQLRNSAGALDALNRRVDALVNEGESARVSAAAIVPRSEYVITSVGVSPSPATVPNRAVLSATMGEPLVKLVALGYGVRRALSPENRNRITFEMRREVKRARKQRRRETKDAVREARRREAAA